MAAGDKSDTPKKQLCTSTTCIGRATNGRIHTADNCWMLHPEKRPSSPYLGKQKPEGTPKKSLLATASTPVPPTVPDTKYMEDIVSKMDQLFLEVKEAVKVIRDKRLHKSRVAIPPDKPHYLDSGNNYSVIASPSHIDTDTNIQLSDRVETLKTASGQQLAISGTGTLLGVDAIYVPDTIASLSSVSQLNEARNAVSIFVRMEVSV